MLEKSGKLVSLLGETDCRFRLSRRDCLQRTTDEAHGGVVRKQDIWIPRFIQLLLRLSFYKMVQVRVINKPVSQLSATTDD